MDLRLRDLEDDALNETLNETLNNITNDIAAAVILEVSDRGSMYNVKRQGIPDKKNSGVT